MTVAELIEKLKTMPQDIDVLTEDCPVSLDEALILGARIVVDDFSGLPSFVLLETSEYSKSP